MFRSNPTGKPIVGIVTASLRTATMLALTLWAGHTLQEPVRADDTHRPQPITSLLTGQSGQGTSQKAQDQPTSPPGKSASAAINLRLNGPNGQTLDLASRRGHPFILHIWATWCGPCKKELPHLNAFLHAHRDAPVVTVAVASGDAGKVSAFLDKTDNHAITPWTADKNAVKQWLGQSTIAIPVTILVDANGYPRAQSESDVDWDDPRAEQQISDVFEHLKH